MWVCVWIRVYINKTKKLWCFNNRELAMVMRNFSFKKFKNSNSNIAQPTGSISIKYSLSRLPLLLIARLVYACKYDWDSNYVYVYSVAININHLSTNFHTCMTTWSLSLAPSVTSSLLGWAYTSKADIFIVRMVYRR